MNLDRSLDILGMPQAARRLVRVGCLAVLEAHQQPRVPARRPGEPTVLLVARKTAEYKALGLDPDVNLVDEMVDLGEGIPLGWGIVSMLAIAVDERHVPAEELGGGALHRRIDAIYDVFETDFCAHEAQALFADRVEAMRSASKGKALEYSQVAGNMVGAFAAGYLTGGAGVGVAAKAATWVDGLLSKVSTHTKELGFVLLAYDFLDNEDAGVAQDWDAHVVGQLRRERDSLAVAAADSGNAGPVKAQWNMVNELVGLFQDAGPEGDAMPDLHGLLLPHAIHKAEVLGLHCKYSTEENDTFVLVRANWRVAGQSLEAGARITEGHPAHLVVKKDAVDSVAADHYDRLAQQRAHGEWTDARS